MSYTRKEIIDRCNTAIQDPSNLYKEEFINYRGKTKDTNEFFTEIIAGFILDHIDAFDNIQSTTRQSSYKVDSHKGMSTEISNRIEEITAKQIFIQSEEGYVYEHIGRVIDYQTPLKNDRYDQSGKIDLISVNDNILYILELKQRNSNETMLRCVLEAYTYLKILDKEKLVSNFELQDIRYFKASPLVFYKSRQWEEMLEERPKLKELMLILNSTPFYLVEESGKYSVEGS